MAILVGSGNCAYNHSTLLHWLMHRSNGYSEDRPRKRARVQNAAEKSVVELWWDAMRADDMLTSGVPGLAYPTSSSSTPPSSSPARAINDPPREAQTLIQTPRRRRKKKKRDVVSAPNTLLFHMNNNVRTLRRVRTTHAKFTALTQALEEAGGAGVAVPFVNDIPDDADDVLDERPWRPVGRGIDMGEGHATECLQWMGGKVLEHAGFQGECLQPRRISAHIETEAIRDLQDGPRCTRERHCGVSAECRSDNPVPLR